MSTEPISGAPVAVPPSAGAPEVLESGSGGSVPSGRRARSGGGGGGRKGLIVGGTVIGLGVAGAGVWAATSFFGTGPQPAEALPSTTLGYASIDLDPSGGQKIAALTTLRKFPAFKDKVGFDTTDDIRKDLFADVQKTGTCKDLSFANDIDPWLGNRAAVAAVDTGGKNPEPVLAVQVKDAGKARAGLQKIVDCSDAAGSGDSSDGGSTSDDMGGFVVNGDWALIATSTAVAQEIADETKKASLADDSDFKKWTSAAGDSGIVTLYAAPRVGPYLVDHYGDQLDNGFGLGSLLGGVDGGTFSTSVAPLPEPSFTPVPVPSLAPSAFTPAEDNPTADRIKDALRQFKGAAMVFRFHDGGFELEGAGSGLNTLTSTPDLSSDKGSDVIETLPSDTGAAIGAGFAAGWFTAYLQNAGSFGGLLGGEGSDLTKEFTDQTGLTPADVETLLGSSAALAVGGDVDPETVENSSDYSQVPVALKVQGDPDQIKAVLAKISDKFGSDAAQVVGSDQDGDVIAIGPDATFRKQVLGKGGLGGSDGYQHVVDHRSGDSSVFYVNVDRLEKAIDSLAGDDKSFVDNVKPLEGIGMSTWKDGDVAHFRLRVTTD